MMNKQSLRSMNLTTQAFLCAAAVAGITAATSAGPSGGAYELSWYTIDGGGTTSATGGSFELSGTIGQSDAGAAMTGGSFSLTGGFWAGVSSTPPCAGDVNGDGLLDFFDVADFLDAYAAQDPIADFTNDGLFDFFDVSEFLEAFAAGCP